MSFESPQPLRTERRDVRAAVASDLKHIFLIAGPSGSGKSTFMREFVYDRLPRDISDYLPADAKTWQRTSGNELSRKGLARVLAAGVPQASWSTTISCALMPGASSTTPTIRRSRS
jgi:hypothetical protein